MIIFSDLAKFFMISLTFSEAQKFLCNYSFFRLVDTLLMSVGMLDLAAPTCMVQKVYSAGQCNYGMHCPGLKAFHIMEQGQTPQVVLSSSFCYNISILETKHNKPLKSPQDSLHQQVGYSDVHTLRVPVQVV